ncbi:MAG: nucleoside hydrolase [Planctomycetaceae bacterium]|jgi:purine nucleosidase|nr:nucleoside hydrolase [Planctomycetaceae bacterium]
MAKKVLLDVDPGIDDAMVLCLALFDPAVEVVAVTSTGGNVTPQVASRNLQAIVEYLDPPRLPRIGFGTEADDGLPVDGRYVHGIDGLGGTNLPCAALLSQHPAEKVICDAVRSAPGEITIITLAPLTNIARAFQRDQELPQLVGEMVIMGGTFDVAGNITPAAEFNIFCDPVAAKQVFQAPCTKTLIPLDVTNRIKFTLGDVDNLPPENTKIGGFLRSILMPAFRAYRQRFGLEGIHIHDMVTYMAAIYSELFTMKEVAGNVETIGELTRGMTIFDRRRVPDWQANMEVAYFLQKDVVLERTLEGLKFAAEMCERKG